MLRPRDYCHRQVCWVALLAGFALAGCSLPYEQITTPTPIETGSLRDQARTKTTKTGIPLSSPAADEVTEPRVYTGSGELTSTRTGQAGRGPGFVTDQPARAGGSPSGVTQNGPAGTSASTRDGITINLVGASVVEVAKTVLGDVLGVNYIVSEKVKSTITMRTVRPVDKAGLLEIFEAVLRAEGAALIVDGGVYRIIPASDAAGAGAPLRRNRGSASTPGLSTEIIPLRYVAAGEMERILKQAAPQSSVLRADAQRNVLVVSGSQAELGQIRDLINVFDVDSMRGMSFGLFPIETADPEAIAQELDVIFANDRDSATKGVVRFLGNRRLKTVFVITPRPEYMKKAATWINRLDKASAATEKRINIYHVQHRPAGEVATLLQKIYGGRDSGRQDQTRSPAGNTPAGSGFADGSIGGLSAGSGFSGGTAGGLGAPSAAGAPQPIIGGAAIAGDAGARPPGAGVGPITESPAQVPADTPRPASGFGSGLPPDDRQAGISIVADDANNSIVVTATAAEYKRILRALQKIDSAPVQVLLEGTIAEVRLTDAIKFGVRWFFQNNEQGIGFTPGDTAFATATNGFSYFLNAANTKVLINALSTVTDVNILSTPSLTVIENKKAVLQVGDEVPILTQTAVPIVGQNVGNTSIVNSVTYRNTGVILSITPRVGNDGRVLLEIEQEVSQVLQATTGGIQSPTIQQRRVKTTVTVRDGQTIVLAGLIRDQATRTRDQIPILGDIPFIGQAFKSKDDTIDRTELLIAITPQVLRDDSQIAAVTKELSDSINFSTRPQRGTPPDHREQLDRLLR